MMLNIFSALKTYKIQSFFNIKNMTYLIYIFALASHAMILYIYAPILSTDSQSYCEAMTTFLNGAIDKWRTPFYPLFIYLCKLISPIDNFLFTVCVMQSLIFIYSAKFLHLLSGRFIKNENIKLFILAIYSIVRLWRDKEKISSTGIQTVVLRPQLIVCS